MEKQTKVTRAKNTNKSYSSKFLKRSSMRNRGDRSIYIRPEYHQTLTRIATIIGSGKIPLYAYLDNILKHHFELYSEEIHDEYKKNDRPLL